MSDAEPCYAKVAFHADDGEVETLWAFDLGDGRYRLDGISWFQYGISSRDVVAAEPVQGQLSFTRVIEKAGHRTVRVAFDSPRTPEDPILVGLVNLGCTFEGFNAKLFAIDVPPSCSLPKVAEFLTNEGARWEHADPTYTQLYGENGEP
jgi:hypothetical protein